MIQPYVIACDLGTSGVKVVGVSFSGEILADALFDYPLYVSGMMAEQDPSDYWNAVCKGIRSLLDGGLPANQCKGLAFGTQWRGIIPIDADGNTLRRGIIWMDKRAKGEALALNKAMGQELFCEGDYWPKLLWLKKNEPEIYKSSRYILEANAFLKWRATACAVSDITNCYTRSYGEERQVLFDRILSCAELDQEKFPPICRATDMVGTITREAAEQTGFCAGTPVFGGCCDIPALVIGCGCSAMGDVHSYLGTSGWLGCVTPYDPKNTYCPPIDENTDISFYGFGASVGASTNWFLNTYYPREKERFGAKIWYELEKELEPIPAGAERLLAAPWFFGCRPPFASCNARGLFVNLGEQHTRAHMLRALLESFCYIMRQNLERLNEKRGEPVGSISVCGGGAKNRFWMQAAADILKLDIQVPANSQSSGAVGVAYCALIGLGVYKNFRTLRDHITIEKVYHPNPEHFAEYDLLYTQFTKLYGAMADIFDALNDT